MSLTPAPAQKILLLDFREAEGAAYHRDVEGVIAASGMPVERLKTVLAFSEELAPTLLDGVAGVILGGSKWSVFEDYPRATAVESFVGQILRRGLPILGICFGHQLLAKVLGGTVIRDTAGEERGTFAISLTPAGCADRLFGAMPPIFLAQCSHQDRVSIAPPGAVVLAKSDACAIHAFTMPGRPIYAVQFHPERSKAQFTEMMRDRGLPESARAALCETPEAASLIEKFLKTLILANI